MTTTVYKVSGNNTNSVYYGYAPTGSEMETFLAGCHRAQSNRGDQRMLAANNNDEAGLSLIAVATVDDEFDAWCLRNDHRAQDLSSITGPTMFPANWGSRARTEHAGKVESWIRTQKIHNATNARDAYALGAYTFEQLDALCKVHPKSEVKQSLDTLTHVEFCNKYNIR